jgi:hypothetical protein
VGDAEREVVRHGFQQILADKVLFALSQLFSKTAVSIAAANLEPFNVHSIFAAHLRANAPKRLLNPGGKKPVFLFVFQIISA